MSDSNKNDILFRVIEETKHREEGPSVDEDAVAEVRVNEPREDYIEVDDEFSFDGFQVVRREFFAHLTDPSITFNN